ncbi:MAG TPA: hypothetical protein VGL94_22645 [Ktedonobacteraceae bacterium]|jgi:hypothetical protein
MSLTLAAIGGIVGTMVKYLLANKAPEIAGQKAVEKIGEAGGQALTDAGKQAFHGIKQALTKRGENAKKANKALTDVEEDPTDEDYQRKLTNELEKLAASDTDLRGLLEHLSSVMQQAQTQISGKVEGAVNVSDQGKIYGPTAGVNTGTMFGGTYNINDKDDSE